MKMQGADPAAEPAENRNDGLLVLGGPVTVLPLLCFALAARRLNLSTLGFMQFIAPTRISSPAFSTVRC